MALFKSECPKCSLQTFATGTCTVSLFCSLKYDLQGICITSRKFFARMKPTTMSAKTCYCRRMDTVRSIHDVHKVQYQHHIYLVRIQFFPGPRCCELRFFEFKLVTWCYDSVMISLWIHSSGCVITSPLPVQAGP